MIIDAPSLALGAALAVIAIAACSTLGDVLRRRRRVARRAALPPRPTPRLVREAAGVRALRTGRPGPRGLA